MLSPIQRILRRVPPLRWCAFQYALKTRASQLHARQLQIDTVLMSLGNITIAWAGIGLILNSFIEAHHNQLGRPIRTDGLPRDFTAKLDYLAKVEREPIWNPAHMAELREMRLELAQLNQRRVTLVHGLLLKRGTGWSVHVAKEQGHNLMRKDVPHTAQEILRFSGELVAMGGKLSRFFDFLLNED